GLCRGESCCRERRCGGCAEQRDLRAVVVLSDCPDHCPVAPSARRCATLVQPAGELPSLSVRIGGSTLVCRCGHRATHRAQAPPRALVSQYFVSQTKAPSLG